jgi:hypothetical protein
MCVSLTSVCTMNTLREDSLYMNELFNSTG